MKRTQELFLHLSLTAMDLIVNWETELVDCPGIYMQLFHSHLCLQRSLHRTENTHRALQTLGTLGTDVRKSVVFILLFHTLP